MLKNKIDDELLKDVNGGTGNINETKQDTKDAYCPKCKETRTFNLYSGGRAICQVCGEQILL